MAEPQEAKPFTCECDEKVRTACAGYPFYREHEGKLYCVLHYPGPEKASDFAVALKAKLDAKSFDFGGVWFPDPSCRGRREYYRARGGYGKQDASACSGGGENR